MNEEINLSGTKIMVTGASGFIGTRLCKRLVATGSEVVGVSRTSRQDPTICNYWMKGDLSHSETAKKILQTVKPDVVFHLASHVVGARDVELVMPTFNDNLTSTVNLLIESNRLGCQKVILIGSLEEPENSNVHPIPSSPYAAAKSAASAYGRMFHALYDSPVTIARLFMVYGPGQRDLKKLIPFVILSLFKKQIPKLTSGTRLVDWIYLDDVVDALVRMVKAPQIEGETLDIGSGELHSVRSVVHKISELIDPTVEISFGDIADRPMEQVRTASVEKTFSKIGWKPATTLTMGLEKTINWFQTKAEAWKQV